MATMTAAGPEPRPAAQKPLTRMRALAIRQQTTQEPPGGQKLCYMGHATMENRHGGLAVLGMVTLAGGTAERRASQIMLKAKAREVGGRIAVGEDKAYDTADHVAHLRAINVAPHVTQGNDCITATGKVSSEPPSTDAPRHEGYGMSQSCRAMIECIFGWGKRHGTMRKTKHRGLASISTDFMLNLIAYNLTRIPKLLQRHRSASVHNIPTAPEPEPKGRPVHQSFWVLPADC